MKFAIRKTVYFSCLIITVLFIAGCQSKSEDIGRSPTLLDNVISRDGKVYEFEHIPWFMKREDVMKEFNLKEEDITLLQDGDTMKISHTIPFKKPKTEATVIYNFDDNQLVSGTYVINAGSEDELVRVGTELKKTLEDFFPKPAGNTLEELSEEVLRSGKSSGVRWEGEDHSSFDISIPEPKSEYIMTLSVHGPKEPKKSLQDE